MYSIKHFVIKFVSDLYDMLMIFSVYLSYNRRYLGLITLRHFPLITHVSTDRNIVVTMNCSWMFFKHFD